jgi:hypothetical protein
MLSPGIKQIALGESLRGDDRPERTELGFELDAQLLVEQFAEERANMGGDVIICRAPHDERRDVSRLSAEQDVTSVRELVRSPQYGVERIDGFVYSHGDVCAIQDSQRTAT